MMSHPYYFEIIFYCCQTPNSIQHNLSWVRPRYEFADPPLPPTTTKNSVSVLSQFLLNQFGPNFKVLFLGSSSKATFVIEISILKSCALKGRVQIKKCPKNWKKSKRGEGVSTKNQKVHNSKCKLFEMRGGVRIFEVFRIRQFLSDFFYLLGGVPIRPGNNSQLSCSLAQSPKNFCEKLNREK